MSMKWYLKEMPFKNDNADKLSYKQWKGESAQKRNYDKFIREIRAKKQSLKNLKERTETND